MEDVGDLVAAARTETGLDDFGEDTFREGLERLVRALRTEARLNSVGEYSVRAVIVRLLKNRLRIEDWYRRHPQTDEEPIERPLVGLGLPRTGSTALAALLGEDPRARSLRLWEAVEPCPPPATVIGPDQRIAAAEETVRLQHEVAPRMAALVPSSATGPYECHDLMGLDFKSHFFQAFAHIPSYSTWLVGADLTPTYRYERRALKLLQWGEERRPWRLKSPTHLLFLDHLDRAFPDARFVMTHRDPAEVIVSVADLYSVLGGMFSDDVDPRYLGALNIEQWAVGMRRALAFRAAGNEHRFFDLDFRAIQRDPIAAVRSLYAWLGEPVTPEFEAGMARWWRENAESREPNVHPDPATFGIDPEQVRPLFADYSERAARWIARDPAGKP
ncbi:Sulfotransferase family protein [Parafrankia irregularis]|uniref:Sulfotransferase family protein n=1 Tax=Parafrankia irregularis TaxID=795642 RepID=A0A0S4QUG0_9ACTN|nr:MULTISPECIES: sulfotransferase [Parafrankia]MBE3200001.1 sulfotransferase [Parafrankia sp. CH37]CUU59253.1 Sulfotransferase family protein [Parafrankia irregularis]